MWARGGGYIARATTGGGRGWRRGATRSGWWAGKGIFEKGKQRGLDARGGGRCGVRGQSRRRWTSPCRNTRSTRPCPWLRPCDPWTARATGCQSKCKGGVVAVRMAAQKGRAWREERRAVTGARGETQPHGSQANAGRRVRGERSDAARTTKVARLGRWGGVVGHAQTC